jgi:hypothetical protein
LGCIHADVSSKKVETTGVAVGLNAARLGVNMFV